MDAIPAGCGISQECGRLAKRNAGTDEFFIDSSVIDWRITSPLLNHVALDLYHSLPRGLHGDHAVRCHAHHRSYSSVLRR